MYMYMSLIWAELPEIDVMDGWMDCECLFALCGYC